MPKNVIKESQIRQIVKVMLEDKTLGPAMVKVNPVVDPSAAVTDPGNPNYKPDSKIELQVALHAMIDDLPDTNVPSAYDAIKDALSANEEEEGKDQMAKSNEKIEEVIRLAVRRMLEESKNLKEYYAKDPETGEMVWKGTGPAPGKITSKTGMQKIEPGISAVPAGPKTPAVKALRKSLEAMKDFDPEVTDVEKPAPGRGRKNVMMTDVEGASFDEIAKELGFSHPSGAKGAVVKALEKAKFVGEMDPDELDILVLNSMNDYVNMLSGTGELTPADVKLLKDHPDIVRELDGFREYLDKALRSARKSTGG